MQIILLSGGSGKRLWPLSNNTRSKQFIKLLTAPDGSKESMVQRVVRQLRETGICDSITVATSQSQRDIIINQLGEEIPVVTEPERRDTFPAIALASSYLAYKRKCSTDEIIIVMPCDPYTETGYFETIRRIADAVKNNVAELVLMGINPTYPSAKYGYVVPVNDVQNKGIFQVSRFTEKPDMITAEKLISEGAFWNGGVFAFRLGYMTDIVTRHIKTDTFSEIRSRYGEFPKISFDYEVAEKAQSVAVVPFAGEWKDLGTWNTLTDELSEHTMGNVVMDEESENTHVINELGLPIMCIGTRNLVIAASNDGILISDKDKSENIKTYADCLQHRPMFEERRWGEYKVVDTAEFSDGYKSLTKQLKIKSGKSISYQVHRHRDEVWTFIDGEGELVLDDIRSVISRGDTITIKKGVKHAVRAIFLEQESVQKKGTQFIFRYAFYSVEKPRKITKQHLLKEYAGVPLEKRSVQPEQIPDMKQYSDIILYGDASSPEAQQQLAEYLQQHNSLKVQLSFFDKRNDSTSKDEQAIAYAELQKALFFCQRKKIPLLFVSLKGMIDDIRFLNLLEESHVDFRCIDFPWFCKENLPLIKAVVLYEKLEIRINV